MSNEKTGQTLLLFIILLSWIYPSQGSGDFKCGKPGRTPDNEYKDLKNEYKAGEIVKYTCRSGLISNPSIRKCSTNGTWTEKIPVCYSPVDVTSARLSSFYLGSSNAMTIDGIKDTCSSTNNKDDNAFWEGVLKASVEIKVVRITFPVNEAVDIEVIIKSENGDETRCGNYSGNLENINSIEFHCSFGAVGSYVHIRDLYKDYRIRPYFTICEVEIFLRSEPKCLHPDIPLNGRGRLNASYSQEEYIFSCQEGYELWGNKKTICLLDGTWAPKSPTCQRITCLPPQEIENGRVSYDVDHRFVPFNGTATYHCNSGFILDGATRTNCIRWNTWDRPPPICREGVQYINNKSQNVRCENFPEVANGQVIINSTAVGSVAKLVCNEGFRPLSVHESYCLPSGIWNSSGNLLCSAIQCELNPIIPHGTGKLLDNSNFYGARLQIICNRGKTNTLILRKCQQSATWGDLDTCVGITCDSLNINEFSGGHWQALNATAWIRVLVCPPDLHIEGSPAVIQCLSNGSWSYTSAVCKKNPEFSHWVGEWTPSALLLTAIAIGAGTAICILCLAMTCLVIRKRRLSKTNTTVFHLGVTDSAAYNMGTKEHALSENQNYSRTDYEDIELRQKSFASQPRKPRSALPHLPFDADPVYAQPFESGGMSKKISTATMGNKDDLYNAHIYAEPVDSRTPPLCNNISSGMTETWFHTGTGKFNRKLSLPDCPGDQEQTKCDNVNALYEPVFCHSSNLNCDNGELGGKYRNSEAETKEQCDTLINNSIYLEAGKQNLPSRVSLDIGIIDNDIYLSDRFQNT